MFLRIFFSTLMILPSLSAAEAEPEKKEELPSQIQYLSPGIIGIQGNEWVGSDHLLNVSSEIAVTVEMVKPEGAKISLNPSDLQDVIVKEFDRAGISTEVTAEPPLPFFHLLVIIQPQENSFDVYIEGRLFEAVTLKRVTLQHDTTFQAITWERQNLLFLPKNEFEQKLVETTKEITDTFIQRYKHFEALKQPKK